MLISPALAHGLVHAETAGGGTALLIILAIIVGMLLVFRSRKKWRKRKLQRDGGGE